MKKPIEQQVAELTLEQRGSLKKIYKRTLVAELIVAGIAIFACLAMFIFLGIETAEAKEEMEFYQTQIEIEENMPGLNFDFELHEEYREAMDEYYDLKQVTNIAYIAIGLLAMLAIVGIAIFVKTQYPYFSEAKYRYCKKNNLI